MYLLSTYPPQLGRKKEGNCKAEHCLKREAQVCEAKVILQLQMQLQNSAIQFERPKGVDEPQGFFFLCEVFFLFVCNVKRKKTSNIYK